MHPRTAEPRGEGEGERRSPTGIARERETSVDHAAPYQRADRTTFESRSARPLAAPLPGPCLQTGTAARRAAQRASPIVRKRGDGLDRRPPASPPGGGRHRWAKPSERRLARLRRHVRLQPIPLQQHVPQQIRLLRHVRPQPIPLQRHVPRQIPLLRHVRLHPIPLQRHVPRADPATATCSPPPDPATATCSPGRSGYCDMFGPNRSR